MPDLSSLPGFVAELFRAANEISRVGMGERSALLERAAHTITDMRERIALSGEPADWNPAEPTFRYRVMSIRITETSDKDAAAELLHAALMIQTLKIVMDARVEVMVERGTP